MKLDEQTGFIIVAAGGLVALAGGVWLVARAFRTGFGWGVLALVPGLNLIFVAAHFRRAWPPVLVSAVGGLIAAAPVGLNKVFGGVEDRGQTETKTDPAGTAEERLTLTSAKPAEYDILLSKKTFAVVQWANADVTDDLADRLRGMPNLRELDLNSSAVTDKTLEVVAALPKLESLRVAGTKVTDAGFRTHILPLANLKELDLGGTAVKSATGREWKARNPDRKLLN